MPAEALTKTEERWPFDPPTLLRGLWRRRWWGAAWFALCATLGVLAGLYLGFQVWEAEAVLIYQPPASELLAGLYEAPSIQTQLNMVKVKSNLIETRARLGLPSGVDELGAAVSVEIPRDSNLLVIRAAWDDGERAAALANTLAAVFMAQQQRLRKTELGNVVGELERRLDKLRQGLTPPGEPDEAAQAQTEQRLRELQTRLDALEGLEQRARADVKAAQRQLTDLDELLATLRRRHADESSQAAATEGLSELNIRAERLREAIGDERAKRRAQVDLQQWQARLAHNRSLLEKGVLTTVQHEQELAEFEKLKVSLEDSPETGRLKSELDEIYRKLTQVKSGDSASSPTLRNLEMTRYNLQLEHSAAEERLREAVAARAVVERERALLAAGEARAAPRQPLLAAWRREAAQLEETLARARALHESKTADFGHVAHATSRGQPSKSYRKLIALGVMGLGWLLGAAALAAWELRDTTIKSRGDVALRLTPPLLGELPLWPADCLQAPLFDNPRLVEPMRGLARRVRTMLPRKGARLLITSVYAAEGRSAVARNLAACLGQQGVKALLVDGAVRGPGRLGADLERGSRPAEAATSRAARASDVASPRGSSGRPPAENGSAAWRPDASSFPASAINALDFSEQAFANDLLGDNLLGDNPLGDNPLGDNPLGDNALGDNALGEPTPGEYPPWSHAFAGGGASESPDLADELEEQDPWSVTAVGALSLQGLGDSTRKDLGADDPSSLEDSPSRAGWISADNLGSPRVENLFDELAQKADLLLIDGPPAGEHADAELLCTHATAVLLVIESCRCSAAAARETIERLESCHTPILGIVLNKVPAWCAAQRG